MKYNKEQIKIAFWKTFKGQGEFYFSPKETEEGDNRPEIDTNLKWEDFEDFLDNPNKEAYKY